MSNSLYAQSGHRVLLQEVDVYDVYVCQVMSILWAYRPTIGFSKTSKNLEKVGLSRTAGQRLDDGRINMKAIRDPIVMYQLGFHVAFVFLIGIEI